MSHDDCALLLAVFSLLPKLMNLWLLKLNPSDEEALLTEGTGGEEAIVFLSPCSC